MTSKRKRKYAQDFSGKSMTDKSFTASCDVNNIVAQYERTGIDPYAARAAQAQYGEAPTITFSEGMQVQAELKSAFASQPASVRAEHANDPIAWYESLALIKPPEMSQEPADITPAEPAPQDASDGES